MARTGETAPCSRGGFCPVAHAQQDIEEVVGSSASLEGLSRLIPLDALGVPQALQVVHPNQTPKVPPLALQLACLGFCSLLPVACSLQSPQLCPDVSLWFPPCLPALLKILGSKYPTAGAAGLHWGLRGGCNSPFMPSRKVPFGQGQTDAG